MAKMLFWGGRLDSVAVTGTVTEVTTAGTFDSSYADCALSLNTSPNNHWTATFKDDTNTAVDVVTGETLYTHTELTPAVDTTTVVLAWVLLDSSNQPWLALRTTSSNDLYGLYYNSNTGASPTWTLLGSTFTLSDTVRYRLDCKLTLGSPHSVEFSINEVAAVTTTFTQASLTALRAMRGYGLNGGNNLRWSQLMATEGLSTIGGKVKYSRPTGAGGNSAWTGAYTNVNAAIDNTGTVDTAASAALKQTYVMGDVTVPSGFVIKGVSHCLYAKNDGVAPQNIKSLLRTSSTDYPAASDLSGISTSFLGLNERYNVDPATTAAWTDSGFNAFEAGYLSAT
jgi:hypothetical protein